MDRIDIHIEVPPVRYKELSGDDGGETSSEIKKKGERCTRDSERQVWDDEDSLQFADASKGGEKVFKAR